MAVSLGCAYESSGSMGFHREVFVEIVIIWPDRAQL